MPGEWYVQIDGTEYGPESSEQLRKMAISGRLPHESLVRKGPSGKWVAAVRVKGLFEGEGIETRAAPPPVPETGETTPSPDPPPPEIAAIVTVPQPPHAGDDSESGTAQPARPSRAKATPQPGLGEGMTIPGKYSGQTFDGTTLKGKGSLVLEPTRLVVAPPIQEEKNKDVQFNVLTFAQNHVKILFASALLTVLVYQARAGSVPSDQMGLFFVLMIVAGIINRELGRRIVAETSIRLDEISSFAIHKRTLDVLDLNSLRELTLEIHSGVGPVVSFHFNQQHLIELQDGLEAFGDTRFTERTMPHVKGQALIARPGKRDTKGLSHTVP